MVGLVGFFGKVSSSVFSLQFFDLDRTKRRNKVTRWDGPEPAAQALPAAQAADVGAWRCFSFVMELG